MLSAKIKIAVFLYLAVFLPAAASFGAEIKTKYATVIYQSERDLKTFNKKIRVNRSFQHFNSREAFSVAEELGNKVDAIVSKVQSILEMFPDRINFKIQIFHSANEVRENYKRRYRRRVKFIAFYSPKDKTIFISAKNAKLQVIAHEIAHVVIHHYFKVAPSSKIHELLAQYADEHITD